MKLFVPVLVLGLLIWTVECERPAVVNVGAVSTFGSVIGRAAKSAMEIAVSDVNENPKVLNGTRLNLIKVDASSSPFMGSIGAFQVIDQQAVAIIGPESSAMAHMISFIANGFKVPLVSYAASDPTLSASQFPFFVRMTQSDSAQMTALADIIRFYEWKEVIAIYMDDEYGRNGISYLADELANGMSKIHFKLPLSINFDLNELERVLNKSKSLGPRVYVAHLYPDAKFRFFKTVKKLNMMSTNYVWFATEWLSTSLESSMQNQSSLEILEGVVGLRPYIPNSFQKTDFVSRWRKMQQENLVHSELVTQALYASDTVWAVAHAIENLLQEGKNLSFSLSNFSENSEIENFRVFEGGEDLLEVLTQINFTGLTGNVSFDSFQNLNGTGYEVYNVAKGQIRTVGYWSNFSRLSLSPPLKPIKNNQTTSKIDRELGNVLWPGGVSSRPRGWLLANSEKPYKIVIPRRTSFSEFVRLNSSHGVEGYCIDVFNEAVNLLPYDIYFEFVPFGNGVSNPSYDNLVKMVANDTFDAAVGDITIVTSRTRIVDFTQPFVDSGVVIVAPVDDSKSSAWVFLKPFTFELWIVTGISFLIVAVVIWILEHRVNDDFRGPPKRQLTTMLLFSFSTLFKTNAENTVSTLGRMVMLVWLFLLLVITSSYTASLTSILTVQQLSSPITGLDSLTASRWRIGYQVGSFVHDYLVDNYNVAPSRLVSLRTPEEYESALRRGPRNGGVAAIVDELPYIELFLANRTGFGIIGQPFAKKGWGYVFQKDSPIAVDLSSTILKLSESRKLYEIYKKWFCNPDCPSERGRTPEPDELQLSSFWGLYLLCGAFTFIALLIFMLRTVRQYIRYQRKQIDPSSPLQTNAGCRQVVYSFFDFIDEKEEAIKNFFTQHDGSQISRNNI